MCSIVFCEHPFSRIFGIICNHLEFSWIFWFFLILTIILESIKKFWDFPDSFVSAGWHCRLFCSRILRILWNHLKYLGRPGTVAPQSYLAVLRVSWAPRVSRVFRALLPLNFANRPRHMGRSGHFKRIWQNSHFWGLSTRLMLDHSTLTKY